MKILVSAIACDPYGGSEGGIGWRIVQAIAADHEVFVMTAAHNRPSWDRARQEGRIPEAVHVRYLGTERAWHQNRMLARAQSWQRYQSFSRSQLDTAREWHRERNFDLVHQVTYASWRVPSDLWKLGPPFLWGPLGGAAYIPKGMREVLGAQGRWFERARDMSGRWASRRAPFIACVSETAMLIAANQETEDFLARFRKGKPLARLWSGYLSDEQVEGLKPRALSRTARTGPLRLFAGGNLEGRKGARVALRALAKAKEAGLEFEYILAGGGPDVESLKQEVEALGLTDREVIFHPGYQGSEYHDALENAEIYLLPSLRETTPVTLLESMAAGCVPVVLDASAGGEIVRRFGGHAVAADSMSEAVEGISQALLDCASNREILRDQAQTIASIVSDEFSKRNFEATLNQIYKRAMI